MVKNNLEHSLKMMRCPRMNKTTILMKMVMINQNVLIQDLEQWRKWLSIILFQMETKRFYLITQWFSLTSKNIKISKMEIFLFLISKDLNQSWNMILNFINLLTILRRKDIQYKIVLWVITPRIFKYRLIVGLNQFPNLSVLIYRT
jgi:hypothetical protein